MLALRVLDATIERMGLGHGASRSAILDEVVPLVRQSDETLSLEDARAIVELVIEGLLNESERRQKFKEIYSAVENSGVIRRTFSFNLLQEVSPDGNYYLQVTNEPGVKGLGKCDCILQGLSGVLGKIDWNMDLA